MAHPDIFASPDPNWREGADRTPSAGPGAPDSVYLALARQTLLNVPDAAMWQVVAGDWIWVSHREALTPLQGWKLHISATVGSAEEVLARALPVLMALPTAFKVAAGPAALLNLNQGGGGMSQVGKFITVYPACDEQMLRLAPLLEAALADLPGPAVPSDRRYRPGSIVHYRYGSFSSVYTQLPTGEVVPAIADPAGELVADRRLTRFEAPAWAVDPFAEASMERSLPARRWVGGRYLILSALHSSPRGDVYLALNFENTCCCVLKSAPLYAAQGLDGYDSQDRLRNEARVLAQLAPHPAFPALYELLEHDGDLYLAMEDIQGETLMQRIGRLAAQGASLPDDLVVEWGRSIAGMLGHLHARGLIYRDVKPTNVLITPDGTLRLIDLELCVAHDQLDVPAAGIGTIGYSSPQQAARGRPRVADDVYGLGALLYFLATGAEPSTAPNGADLLARPIEWLNPQRSTNLASVIRRCLHSRPDARYPTMQAVASALSRVATGRQGTRRATKSRSLPPLTPEAPDPRPSRYRDLAYRLACTLCDEAVIPHDSSNGDGLAWISKHQGGQGLQLRDINIGSAGAVLALSALVAELGDPRHRDVLERAARYLARSRPLARRPLPGLYVGESGVGTALLRAGQALRDNALIEAAEEAGSCVYAMPHASPDLFNGTAGRLRFYLWLFEATGEPAHLNCALAAGERLLASAVAPAHGELLWEIPPGYDGLSGHAYLGYAHGAAGIGDALHDLYRATGRERFLEAALAAARWLERNASPSLPDAEGLAWPATPGAQPSAPFWCHGAGGIARFFLHLSDVDAFPQATALAERAATSAAVGARWAGPTQCHGLAGNIELLLDMRMTTRDAGYLTAAHDLARLLATMAVERDGLLLWPSDSGSAPTPDFMVGYAGVAACFLRLSSPERLPHLL